MFSPTGTVCIAAHAPLSMLKKDLSISVTNGRLLSAADNICNLQTSGRQYDDSDLALNPLIF